MKNLLQKHKASLTGDEQRRIWKAIVDERNRPRKRGVAIPAALGASALALLMMISYVRMDPEDRVAVEELAMPRTEVVEKTKDEDARAVMVTPPRVDEKASLEESIGRGAAIPEEATSKGGAVASDTAGRDGGEPLPPVNPDPLRTEQVARVAAANEVAPPVRFVGSAVGSLATLWKLEEEKRAEETITYMGSQSGGRGKSDVFRSKGGATLSHGLGYIGGGGASKLPSADRNKELSAVPLNAAPGVPVGGGHSVGARFEADGIASHTYVPPGSSRKGDRRFPVSVGGTDPVNGAAFDAMFFEHYGVNPFVDPHDDALATFALDVDNASYTLMRSYIGRDELPPTAAIRVEEFVNAIPHGYDAPYLGIRHAAPGLRGDGSDVFAVHLDAAPSHFGGDDLLLLRVGLKAREIDARNRKPANLTFVIDVSGSMAREDRLELAKRSLYVLLGEMRGDDQVAIVVYGSEARIVLPPTSLDERGTIEGAIEALRTGGSTNAEHGLVEGYLTAASMWRHDAINRVILCSDGVANVGRTGADDILARVARDAKRGIQLTTIGFGMGNYNDILMEKLADNGEGNYYYVDRMSEARRVFRENLTGTLQVVAKQTKVQVEFEPGTVRRYRLIGYENRDVRDEDFRNDEVDAGEVGAGHEVTALFEIKLERRPESDRLATVRLRWEDPESGRVYERESPIDRDDIAPSFGAAEPRFRLDAAIAEFAEILRGSYWAKDGDLGNVHRVAATAARNMDPDGTLDELIYLIHRADDLKRAEVPMPAGNEGPRPRWLPEDDN